MNKKEEIKKPKKKNWIVDLYRNWRNVGKNYKKVKGSPYALMGLSLKFRKIIIYLLIPYLLYMSYSMAIKIRQVGFMGTFQKVFMIGVMGYICWKIYKTIPYAQRQLEYYKKNPHVINYVSTNVKEEIDGILAKVSQNAADEKLKEKQKEVKNNVRKKETSGISSSEGSGATGSTTSAS